MNTKFDLRVAELLVSRLCHDLVGPIGAVGNGLALLSDDEFGMAEDAMQLTTNSARQASKDPQFFRPSHGMDGVLVASAYWPLSHLSSQRLQPTRPQLL